MAAPEITVTFNPPLASDSGSVFDAKAFDTIGKLNPWGLEANAVAAYCGEQSNSALASAVAAAAGSLDLVDRAGFAGQVVGVENGPGYPLAGFDIEEIQPATQAQAEAGTGTGVYMDPLRTKQAIEANFAGLNPAGTWQDVSASRTAGTSYQNTTGFTIVVNVRPSPSAAAQFQVSTNNITWVTVAWPSGSDGLMYSAIVPPGHYYRQQAGYSAGQWAEFR